MEILEFHARIKKKLKITEFVFQNKENHANHIIPNAINKIMKILEYHAMISKIIKIIELQRRLMKIMEIIEFHVKKRNS